MSASSLRLALAALCLGILFPSSLRADISFADEAGQRGVVYTAVELPTSEVGVAGQSQGAAFVDLDGDGDDDLVLIGESGAPPAIFENDGLGFFERRPDMGLPALDKPSSATAADYDSDGDPDLFIGQFNAANYLLRNDGHLHFSDVTAAAGLIDEGATTGTTWGDFDQDGDLDLYVCNYPNSYDETDNRLFRNRGDGTFEEIAGSLGLDDSGGMTFQASFVDYDLDGDLDLYSVNDRGSVGEMLGNRLWRNLGYGNFQDVSGSSGAGLHMFAMGIAFGDIDRNGWPDFYVTNIENNAMLFNNGNTFTDRSAQWKVLGQRVSWGTDVFDADHDGFLDIMVCNTPLGDSDSPAPRLYDCNGVAPCTDVAGAAGLALTSPAFGVTTSDLDRDGDVDMLIVRPDLPVSLYINQLQDPARHWLKVRLVADAIQHQPVGATVFVMTGDTTQQRALVLGSSYKSQISADLHFGLDAADAVDRVEVLWPGGARTCVPDVMSDQLLILDEAKTFDVPPVASQPSPPSGSLELDIHQLSWADAGDVTYDLYFGEESPPPFVTTTSSNVYPLSGLEIGVTYFWRVDSRACETTLGPIWSFSLTDPVDGNSNMNGNTAPSDLPPDASPGGDDPWTVSITSPTSEEDFSTTSSVIEISGVATGPIAAVQWASDRGAQGTCVGTTAWSTGSIALAAGDNQITITALVSEEVQATDQITITYLSPDPFTDDLPPSNMNDNTSDEPLDDVPGDPAGDDSDVEFSSTANSNDAMDDPGSLDGLSDTPDPPADPANRPTSSPRGLACGAALLEFSWLFMLFTIAHRKSTRLGRFH